MEQKIVNICIDDVLRDYSNAFLSLYEQTYPDRDKITDFNPYDINKYFFNKKEEEEFLHLENQFELLGMATECYQGCSQDYNKVKYFLNNEGYTVRLCTTEQHKAQPTTLYFLAKHVIQSDEIKFFKNNLEITENCSILLSSNPEILSVKKDGMVVVKLDMEYNKNIETDFTIREIKDLPKIIIKLLK
jgi:hypothetical protein